MVEHTHILSLGLGLHVHTWPVLEPIRDLKDVPPLRMFFIQSSGYPHIIKSTDSWVPKVGLIQPPVPPDPLPFPLFYRPCPVQG